MGRHGRKLYELLEIKKYEKRDLEEALRPRRTLSGVAKRSEMGRPGKR